MQYKDTISFVLSVNTENSAKDVKNLDDLKDVSNMSEIHELVGNKNKNVVNQFKLQTPKNIWIDRFICLRNKMYAFKCGDDIENKVKGNCKSQGKNIEFEE